MIDLIQSTKLVLLKDMTDFDGIFSRCKNSFFFMSLIQCGLVSLMYWNVGRGRYWKILFYGSIAGLFGSILESGTLAYICRKSVKDKAYNKIYTLFIAEFFWITNEYSIPFLNLIKMKAFAKGKASRIVNYIVLLLFPLFAFCRFWIGYVRSRDGIIKNPDIDNSHGIAFGIMAIADLICTVSIIYFVRKHNRQEYLKTTNITHYIEKSSYSILLCVDVVSIILAILCFLPNYTSIPVSISIPLHCFKCSFLLVLATDALLFKYEANASSAENSSTYRYNPSDSYNFSKSRTNYSMDNSNQSYKGLNIGLQSESSGYQKSIIKNYTNKPTSTINDSGEEPLTSKNFGFLYQQN